MLSTGTTKETSFEHTYSNGKLSITHIENTVTFSFVNIKTGETYKKCFSIDEINIDKDKNDVCNLLKTKPYLTTYNYLIDNRKITCVYFTNIKFCLDKINI